MRNAASLLIFVTGCWWVPTPAPIQSSVVNGKVDASATTRQLTGVAKYEYTFVEPLLGLDLLDAGGKTVGALTMSYSTEQPGALQVAYGESEGAIAVRITIEQSREPTGTTRLDLRFHTTGGLVFEVWSRLDGNGQVVEQRYAALSGFGVTAPSMGYGWGGEHGKYYVLDVRTANATTSDEDVARWFAETGLAPLEASPEVRRAYLALTDPAWSTAVWSHPNFHRNGVASAGEGLGTQQQAIHKSNTCSNFVDVATLTLGGCGLCAAGGATAETGVGLILLLKCGACAGGVGIVLECLIQEWYSCTRDSQCKDACGLGATGACDKSDEHGCECTCDPVECDKAVARGYASLFGEKMCKAACIGNQCTPIKSSKCGDGILDDETTGCSEECEPGVKACGRGMKCVTTGDFNCACDVDCSWDSPHWKCIAEGRPPYDTLSCHSCCYGDFFAPTTCHHECYNTCIAKFGG